MEGIFINERVLGMNIVILDGPGLHISEPVSDLVKRSGDIDQDVAQMV